MVGRAKSQAKKEFEASQAKIKLEAIAVERYLEELKKPKKDRRGARKVCEEVEIEHKNKTGKEIHLNHSTIIRHANGGIPLHKFNAGKRLLLDEEEEAVLQFAEETSARGFPLSHKRLREHVNSIIRARDPNWDNVDDKWTERFLLRHSERIQMTWSSSLEGARARAANPTNHKEWFELMHKYTKDVEPDCIWAADETGIQTGAAVRERVIGKKGQTNQHQTRGGTHENITVIVTIAADGTSIPPAVIYKGQAFLPQWKQDNPLKASLGHSKKGWTDGELGRAWIEDFDKKTQAKANERRRVLLVDGHNSHYTVGFLLYAREHNIDVLCYPSHCTHLYQGLDVVIFSPLKKYWQQERDIEERERGQKVSKSNFLSVYGRAHIRALTPGNIKSAFRKTGVYPFDPSVIPSDKLAPARETSTKHHPIVPLETPVRILVNAITKWERKRRANDEQENGSDDEGMQSMSSDVPDGLISAIGELAQTSHSLFSSQPLESQTSPPRFEPIMISPIKHHDDLLRNEPQSERERAYQQALRDAEIREAELKGQIRGQQAALVMQNAYADRLRKELYGQEEKKKNKKQSKTALKIKDANKKARLLTDPDLVELYAEHKKEIREQAAEKERRKDLKSRYAEAKRNWDALEEVRKKKCEEINEKYQAALRKWGEEKELAKAEKRHPGWKKPVRGPLLKASPKPKMADFMSKDSSGEEFDEERVESTESETE